MADRRWDAGHRLRAIWIVSSLALVLAIGCGDNGTCPDGGDPDPSYQREWYPVGEGYGWTRVWFQADGTPQDTLTTVAHVDSIVGNTHYVSMTSHSIVSYQDIVSPLGVERRLPMSTADPLVLYRFPLTTGRRWVVDELVVVDPPGVPTDSLRIEAVVAGPVDLQLRTGLLFPSAIRIDHCFYVWPIEGGPVDTLQGDAFYLASHHGMVMHEMGFYDGTPRPTWEHLTFTVP